MTVFKHAAAMIAALILVMANASAAYVILLESDQNADAGSEVAFGTFTTFADIIAGTGDSSGFTDLNLGADISIADIFYDGLYHIFLETDSNNGAGAEIAYGTFESLDQIINNNGVASGFTQIDIGADFDIAGIFFDGEYHIFIELETNDVAGSEIAYASFATFGDLINEIGNASGFTQIDIGADFDIAGITYDGLYHVLLESNVDEMAAMEVAYGTFLTFDNLINEIGIASGFTELNIGADLSIAGIASAIDDMSEIPLPPAALLFLSALAVFQSARRSKLN